MGEDRNEKLQKLLASEFEETLNDMIEAEFNEPILSEEMRKLYRKQHPDSLDGRHFGPLPRDAVIGRAIPLFTDEAGTGHFEWRAPVR